MPQLPEDIIDRLTQMERRIQQLSTAVNSRPALNKISGGGVEITDGGYLAVRPPDGGPAVFTVGAWSGDEYGLAIRRQTGSLAMSLHNGDGSSTSLQPLRIFDNGGREIFADDVNTGGLARPWMTMLPPQDSSTARWPQTTATAWTTVAMSYNVVWQPKMRLIVSTKVSSGGAGSVQVLVNGAEWGTAVAAGTDFDHTGLISSDFASVYGTTVKFEIQAKATSGTVYANPVLMHGRQS
ncbi:hypothetical protein [Streptomyces aurantiogriseus]|uniref:Uncharacterized protein n=1 Tax=Streptomyces aurantiogriseus TaxID=66870 RepID=A0A918F2T1_9ACTN|nr:hypothetical protein [Streptomyces aurantiogriseus]GGQ99489.1 hypothetical protein GCM10010251_13270 [Streptomyces aurantiogriseus]